MQRGENRVAVIDGNAVREGQTIDIVLGDTTRRLSCREIGDRHVLIESDDITQPIVLTIGR